MFNAHSDRMYTARAEGFQEIRVPLHNVENNADSRGPEESSPSSSEVDMRDDGTWGERDIGGPVNLRHAMLDYEEMRRELTNLSKTRSAGQKSTKSTGQHSSGLKRITTAGTRRSQKVRTNEPDPDLEAQDGEKSEGEDEEAVEEEEDFELGEFLKDGHFEKRQEGRSAKKVGVVYKHLTVQGVGATTTFVKTLPNAILGVRYFHCLVLDTNTDPFQTFGPDLYALLSRFIPVLPRPGSQGERRNLVNDFTGVVRDGEMLLVLGRPGSGCSTFLKAVSNKREGFAGVEGEVS